LQLALHLEPLGLGALLLGDVARVREHHLDLPVGVDQRHHPRRVGAHARRRLEIEVLGALAPRLEHRAVDALEVARDGGGHAEVDVRLALELGRGEPRGGLDRAVDVHVAVLSIDHRDDVGRLLDDELEAAARVAARGGGEREQHRLVGVIHDREHGHVGRARDLERELGALVVERAAGGLGQVLARLERHGERRAQRERRVAPPKRARASARAHELGARSPPHQREEPGQGVHALCVALTGHHTSW
jgi:hypothetical protein